MKRRRQTRALAKKTLLWNADHLSRFATSTFCRSVHGCDVSPPLTCRFWRKWQPSDDDFRETRFKPVFECHRPDHKLLLLPAIASKTSRQFHFAPSHSPGDQPITPSLLFACLPCIQETGRPPTHTQSPQVVQDALVSGISEPAESPDCPRQLPRTRNRQTRFPKVTQGEATQTSCRQKAHTQPHSQLLQSSISVTVDLLNPPKLGLDIGSTLHLAVEIAL
ncbi:hypothetical protein HDK90DRAFT_335976 [Phyllosticta capitalensis]|uniref:Uncharacterized protein n=1 Tax=Phyllosticta capitalensis TaxID=121624 RepID=A0ABR1YKR5_9PEZI